MGAIYSALAPQQLISALDLTVEVHDDPNWLLVTAPVVASCVGPSGLSGHGSGVDKPSALTVAVMECIERSSQFGEHRAPVAIIDSAAELGEQAVLVPTLGLYTEEQYRWWGESLGRFSTTAPMAWVRGRRLRDSREVLVPLETVHPGAPTPSPPVVFETSSGSAAGFTSDSAVASALCEVVEHDACLRWWYTRSRADPIDLSVVPRLGAELERLASAGFVVVNLLLPSATALPVVMIVALRGAQVAMGLGCEPHPVDAAWHALRELSTRLRWAHDYPDRRVMHHPSSMVRTGADHAGLYDRGPLHSQFRYALEETTTSRVVKIDCEGTAGSQPQPVGAVEAVLEAGLDPIVVQLPVPPAADGVHVERLLVPGLLPFWVGANRERLGSAGLDTQGQRLVTLLPHPFG